MRLTISNNLTPLLFGVLSGMFAMSAWGATEVRDTNGDIRLTMDGSPYVLVNSLSIRAYDADDSNLCASAQETLTVEPGVVLDLKGRNINVNGGALYIDGATLIGYSKITFTEKTACGETFQGRATITASTLQDLNIYAYDGAALTISHSVLRNTSSSSSRVVSLNEKSTATLMNNEVDSNVYLNGGTHTILMNNEVNSRVYLNGGTHTIEGNLIAQRAFFISSLADRDRSLGNIDGVDRYVLDGSIYRNAYNRGGDGHLCEAAQETLTVEPGVVLDLKGRNINVNGGALYIDGATLIGYSKITFTEKTACGETFQGRATITASTLQDLNIYAYDGAALTISHSVLRNTSSSSSRVVSLNEKSTATLMNNEVDSNVYLNGGTHTILMNNEVNSRVYLNGGTHTIEGNLIAQRAFFISSLADRDRSLGNIDGVDRYVLDGSIYRNAYNRGGDGHLCEAAQETLTVEPGVVLDLKGRNINVNGGALYIDGATLIGYSKITFTEKTACGETFQGRATITASTLQDLNIYAYDGAALTISHSVLRNTSSSSYSSRRLFARDDSIVTITNSDFLGPSGTVIVSTSSQVVVATSNYWGCSTGPNTEGCAGYTGNVQDANWVDAVISGAFTSRSISFELVDIRAFAAGSPLGPLRLALPVEVPPAATKLEIKFRVLDEAGLALPNQAFKVGMENGLAAGFGGIRALLGRRRVLGRSREDLAPLPRDGKPSADRPLPRRWPPVGALCGLLHDVGVRKCHAGRRAAGCRGRVHAEAAGSGRSGAGRIAARDDRFRGSAFDPAEGASTKRRVKPSRWCHIGRVESDVPDVRRHCSRGLQRGSWGDRADLPASADATPARRRHEALSGDDAGGLGAGVHILGRQQRGNLERDEVRSLGTLDGGSRNGHRGVLRTRHAGGGLPGQQDRCGMRGVRRRRGHQNRPARHRARLLRWGADDGGVRESHQHAGVHRRFEHDHQCGERGPGTVVSRDHQGQVGQRTLDRMRRRGDRRLHGTIGGRGGHGRQLQGGRRRHRAGHRSGASLGGSRRLHQPADLRGLRRAAAPRRLIREWRH